MGDAHDEYGEPIDNQWNLPGEMVYSGTTSYDLNTPSTVFGRGQSQTEWESTVTGGLATQWWNAAMSPVYTGFDGATINGNTLVTPPPPNKLTRSLSRTRRVK